MDYSALQRDPSAYRAALLIDCDGSPKRLSDVLDPWQLRDFEALDGGWRRVVGQRAEGKLRSWWERPRGHSKTQDTAVMVCWALFASRRRLNGFCAAADRDQAKLLRDAIDGLCRLNPWLGSLLTVDQFRVSNSHTGSSLEIVSSDAASSYGLLPDFICCDELCHWGRRDLWDSLLSSAAKRANCLLSVISNAGFQDSWQWQTREAIRQDPSWYFSRLEGPQASWITPGRLDEQRRLLPPIAFDRLWLNQWSSGSGDAIDPHLISRAVTLDGPATASERGWQYFAGLDLGLKRDASAFVIVGRLVGWCETISRPAGRPGNQFDAMRDLGLIDDATELGDSVDYVEHPGDGRQRLVDVTIWQPPRGGKIDIEPIEAAVLAAHERFGLSGLAFDPWQAAYAAERLRKAGVPMVEVPFVPSNLASMAQCTLDVFNDRRIDLYDHPQLLTDLRALRVVERQYGIRLESPRGPSGHGDAATALSLALHVAQSRSILSRHDSERKLICG